MSAPRTASAPSPSAVLQSAWLSFEGHATLGDFVGATNIALGAIHGHLAGASGWVETRVDTLATGNALRDRHLRASMEAEIHPTIRFELARTTLIAELDDVGDSLALLLHGSVTVHGVTRPVELPAMVVVDDDTISVSCAFPLDLTQHDVGGLSRLFGLLRVHRWIDVRVHLVFERMRPTKRGRAA